MELFLMILVLYLLSSYAYFIHTIIHIITFIHAYINTYTRTWIGSPSEAPWFKTNIYNFQDVSLWKDLGPKFVLQIYRDYIYTQSSSFLNEIYPVVLKVIQTTEVSTFYSWLPSHTWLSTCVHLQIFSSLNCLFYSVGECNRHLMPTRTAW